jgi:hypothetical protein
VSVPASVQVNESITGTVVESVIDPESVGAAFAPVRTRPPFASARVAVMFWVSDVAIAAPVNCEPVTAAVTTAPEPPPPENVTAGAVVYPEPPVTKFTSLTAPVNVTAVTPFLELLEYVKPVGVPAVVTIAESPVVVKVNPVTEEPLPVIAETLYVVGFEYPVMLPVPPNVPEIAIKLPTAKVVAVHVN